MYFIYIFKYINFILTFMILYVFLIHCLKNIILHIFKIEKLIINMNTINFNAIAAIISRILEVC